MNRMLGTLLFVTLLALGAVAFGADRIYQMIDRGYVYSADTTVVQAVPISHAAYVLPVARGGQETLFE